MGKYTEQEKSILKMGKVYKGKNITKKIKMPKKTLIFVLDTRN